MRACVCVCGLCMCVRFVHVCVVCACVWFLHACVCVCARARDHHRQLTGHARTRWWLPSPLAETECSVVMFPDIVTTDLTDASWSSVRV